MPHLDQDRLRREQYASADNLNARRALHTRFSTNPYGWQRWVFDRLLDLSPTDVLEIGSGPGALWRDNLDRLPASWRVVLSDFSDGMVRTARGALPRRDGFRYAVFDVLHLAASGAAFDCVVANHMLYHVPDRIEALREIARVLRPGGAFLAATNGESHLRELNDLAQRHGFDMEQLDSAPFTLQNGAEQLNEIFQEVVCQRYEDGLRVTDAEPLADYIRSVINAPPDRAAMDGLRRDVAERIDRDGWFTIHKEVGIFTARAARRSTKLG